jgi:acyl-coenzyme A thioesterase 9
MPAKLRLSPLDAAVRAVLRQSRRNTRREFSSSAACQTDGVYGGLTAMRTRTPFIEAFRKQQEAQKNGTPPVPEPKASRPVELAPKKMSDSFHSVVSKGTAALYLIYKETRC